jgi:hypothetical protein
VNLKAIQLKTFGPEPTPERSSMTSFIIILPSLLDIREMIWYIRAHDRKAVINMDREEILEQSRKAGMDERERSVEMESGFYGLLAVIAIAVMFSIYKMIRGLPYRDMVAIICAQLLATSYYKYRKLPERKAYLIGTIAAGIATFASVVAFFLGEYIWMILLN